ncbi:TIGR04104 family putative zinc finger protein [Ornithinibacillus salinisoli]|uniref:TIGR04104 family putative zinc finger protein n=1 Tax=Ornithinibacillus salinisoli TaxID=1848459 RepID=A0ABW4VUM6_9BACI
MFVLQKCEKCNRRFSWSQIYKSFMWTYKPIKCDKCHTGHSITLSGRCTFVFLTIVPMLIFTNFLSPFENFIVTLIIGLLVLTIGSLITPYCVKYREVM